MLPRLWEMQVWALPGATFSSPKVALVVSKKILFIMKKTAPSSLDIGTYTTDTVKIVGSFVFYLVHPDTKKLVEVTFFVAMNDGSILLSCKCCIKSFWYRYK